MHWCECAHVHSNITFPFWEEYLLCVRVECVCMRVPWRVREIRWHLVEERVSPHMWARSTGLSPLIGQHRLSVHPSVSLRFLPILYCEWCSYPRVYRPPFSSVYIPRSGVIGSQSNSNFGFWGTTTLFSRAVAPFCATYMGVPVP